MQNQIENKDDYNFRQNNNNTNQGVKEKVDLINMFVNSVKSKSYFYD